MNGPEGCNAHLFWIVRPAVHGATTAKPGLADCSRLRRDIGGEQPVGHSDQPLEARRDCRERQGADGFGSLS
jgi:hypothetical protein